jgi:uncharacterized membrane protein YkgB
MKILYETIDRHIIGTIRVAQPWAARIAIFVVFFWFGILKVIGTSPATPLVQELESQTLPFIPFDQFITGFGLLEMLIGALFLIPKFERLAILVLFVHMVTTALPLLLVPGVTWSGFLTPTLEGQYIIKNLVIVALALGIAAHLHPGGARSSTV